MYHTVSMLLMSGYVTKEKHKSPPPPNDVAMYVNKGFDNWHVGMAWICYLHLFYEKFERRAKEKSLLNAGGDTACLRQ